MPFTNQIIWIIGASTGIGAALARALHHEGAILILSARSEKALKVLNQELKNKHHVVPLDVAKSDDVIKTAKALHKKHKRLDRVIFLAALYQPAPIRMMNYKDAAALMQVNTIGAFALTQAILPLFEKQQHGQIAFGTSSSTYIGLPNGQPYSASKAALANFAESLDAESPNTIDVKIINPGFVKTRLTDMNNFTMPAIITPEKAAHYIVKGLTKKRFEIHFPKRFTYLLKLISILPYMLNRPLRRMMIQDKS